jgi:site-specific DNA-methyltransferase (adenine-specific)
MTDRWKTPPEVYERLDEEFLFDFDPCPLDGEKDGLATLFVSWVGRRVFCNPPYGPGIKKWLERGLEAEVAVFLLPARTDTRWFHEVVLPKAREIRFIRGRLKFGMAKNSAPFPSMVVILGGENGESSGDLGDSGVGVDVVFGV